ncbi:hypothetical protein BT63DRAFT_463595 [Microthyrium microscopicum]|uniref:DUF7918 domain-containing protein n=1 Tax=Microthyrium microscopicum TaxID=703497 RepID=A0A6A6U1I5_9PEZI|nr:hypothetical protein BT63DRAFT_463595 [Microthyrium microscopicum]
MAIIPGIEGLDVVIRVAGKPTYEYEDPDGPRGQNTARTETLYIESQPGKRFAVDIMIRKEFAHHCRSHIAAHIFVDGALTNRRTFYAGQIVYGKNQVVTGAEDFIDGMQVKRDFIFAETVTVDNEDENIVLSNTEQEYVQCMGEIAVCFYRKEEREEQWGQYRVGRARNRHEPQNRLARLENLHAIPEKALKGRAVSLRTRFGQAKSYPMRPEKLGQKSIRYRWLDPPNRPSLLEEEMMVDVVVDGRTPEDPKVNTKCKAFGSFVFRYRTLRDLKAEMIIPRTPSPEPEHHQRPCDTDTYMSGYYDQQYPEHYDTRRQAGQGTFSSGRVSVPQFPGFHRLSPIMDQNHEHEDDDDVVFMSSRPRIGRQGDVDHHDRANYYRDVNYDDSYDDNMHPSRRNRYNDGTPVPPDRYVVDLTA